MYGVDKDYLLSDSIDGVLIGSASLDKNSIEEMLNIFNDNK